MPVGVEQGYSECMQESSSTLVTGSLAVFVIGCVLQVLRSSQFGTLLDLDTTQHEITQRANYGTRLSVEQFSCCLLMPEPQPVRRELWSEGKGEQDVAGSWFSQ